MADYEIYRVVTDSFCHHRKITIPEDRLSSSGFNTLMLSSGRVDIVGKYNKREPGKNITDEEGICTIVLLGDPSAHGNKYPKINKIISDEKSADLLIIIAPASKAYAKKDLFYRATKEARVKPDHYNDNAKPGFLAFVYSTDIFHMNMVDLPMVPEHEILTEEGIAQLGMGFYYDSYKTMPIIYESDTMAIWLGATAASKPRSKGDIMKITYDSITAGQYVEYRIVTK
jgi:DNA-directed RNA polymerase subunit H (RpoH/RPB5)